MEILTFPHDNSVWEIRWFGGIRRNPNNAGEPFINIIVSRLEGEKATLKLGVGVGQLPIYAIGTKWRDGRKEGAVNHERAKFQLSISDKTITKTTAGQQKDGHYLIPPYIYDLGKNSEAMNSNCLCLEYNNDPFGIIIPMIEVIRFYYLGSSPLCRAFLGGEAGNCGYQLYNEKESSLDENGNCVLKIRKDYYDEDAWIIARIAFDKNALKGAMDIYKSCQLKSISGMVVNPETTIPFRGETELIADGTWFNQENKKRFLALRMISCSGRFPYENLTVIRDNCGREPENGTTDRIPSSWRPPAAARANQPPAGIKVYDHNTPSRDIEALRISLPVSRFKHLAGKIINKAVKETSRYKADGSAAFSAAVTADVFSTGATMYGKSRTAPLSLITVLSDYNRTVLSGEKDYGARFDNFFSGIEILKRMGDIECETKVSVFPPTGTKAIKWASVFDENLNIERPRWVAICQARFVGRYFYILEAECRPQGDEHFTTLIFYQDNFGKISDAIRKNVLINCAKHRGVWFKNIGNTKLRYHKIHHRWDSPEIFAGKVNRIMNGAVGVQDGRGGHYNKDS